MHLQSIKINVHCVITESLSVTSVPHTHNKPTDHFERGSRIVQTSNEEKNSKKSAYDTRTDD